MTGGLHHRGKTVGGNHDEADHGHHLHALGEEVIGLAPTHHTGHEKHDEAGQRAHDHRVQPQLHGKGRYHRHQCHQQGLGTVDDLVLWLVAASDLCRSVIALAAVAEEGHHQTEHHAQRWQGHRVHHAHARGIQAAVTYVGQQNVVEEDGTETHRQEHIWGDQTEGKHTGHQTAVQAQLVHHE